MKYTIIYKNYYGPMTECYEPCDDKDYALEQIKKYKKETGNYAQCVLTETEKFLKEMYG